MKKEEKKKIEKENIVKNNTVRNYIILAVFMLAAMGLTLYFCKVYKVYDDYQKATPVISETLSEISYEELNHYVVDNPSVVLYMCTASDENCRYFEKDFKKYIQRQQKKDEIVYLNLSNTDIDTFIESFNKDYKYKHKLNTNFPAFVSFTDGKVTAILQEKNDKKLSVSKTKHFLDIVWSDEEEEEIEEPVEQ